MVSVGGRPEDARNIYFWREGEVGFGYDVAAGLSWRDAYPLALSGLFSLDDGTKYVLHGVGSGNDR